MHYKPVRRWPLEIGHCWCSREQPRLGDVPLTTDGPACCLEALRTEQSRSVLKGVRVINTQCECVFGLVLVGTGFHPHMQGQVAACAQVLPEHCTGSCLGLQRCRCVSCKCCFWVITLHRAHLNFHVCKMCCLSLYLVWSGQELYVSGVVWAARGRSLMPSLATHAVLIVLSQCSRADYGENWKLALSKLGIKGLQPGNKSCVVELKLNF